MRKTNPEIKPRITNGKTGPAAKTLPLIWLTAAVAYLSGETPTTNPQPPAAMAAEDLVVGDLRKSGTIHLEVSGKPGIQEPFETAVALLHSFFYDEARRRFQEITERDPDCAMAHWGEAMSWIHPLWAPPSLEERALGMAAIQKAKAVVGTSELERGLIGAVDAYYMAQELPAADEEASFQCNCCGPAAHSARALALHEKLGELHQKFPDHVEVATFFALAKLGTVDPKDKTYAVQREAGTMLEQLFETNPDHPGVAHYLIHAYDYPELARDALDAAYRYDDIAPWVPHALHMPTHIYTRLGMWQDSIEGNKASALAARDHGARYYNGAATMDDLHAMDYLMFAYLQTARDSEAAELLRYLEGIENVVPGNEFASAYAIGAIPARYYLERGKWNEAATMSVPLAELVDRYSFAAAHIEFARAVGAARCGDLERAKVAVARLKTLRDTVTDTEFAWWFGQIEIQHLAAKGWLAHARNQTAQAEAFFREAVRIEDEAGTHPVTPGQILPAREQLGEMLLESGQVELALVEFEQSLIAFPRRFRSHLGAFRAASALGKDEVARRHANSLNQMAGDFAERPEARNVVRGRGMPLQSRNGSLPGTNSQ